MTYRVAVRAHVAAGFVLAATVLAATAGSAAPATATLRLDGVPFRPELAVTSGQHQRGLMLRKKAPADGMLFVFPVQTSGGFWMKNTLVPLTIVFFDSRGKRVRKLSMTPCSADPCRIYDPSRTYRFALELPESDARPARKLGPLSALVRLIRMAS